MPSTRESAACQGNPSFIIFMSRLVATDLVFLESWYILLLCLLIIVLFSFDLISVQDILCACHIVQVKQVKLYVHSMKAYRGSGGTAPLFLHWRCMVSLMSLVLYSWRKSSHIAILSMLFMLIVLCVVCITDKFHVRLSHDRNVDLRKDVCMYVCNAHTICAVQQTV
jgi:hypothetical protein